MLSLHSKLLKSNWQTLIVLDACRYDTFCDVISDYDIAGKLTKADSQAYRTSLWYREHWSEYRDDTILITGHPMPWREKKNKNFFKSTMVDGPNFDWIKPNRTLELAIKTQKQFSDKKYLLHLLPPHLPFMGSVGRKFMAELLKNEKTALQIDGAINGTIIYKQAKAYGKKNGWGRLRKCYKENLRYAIKHTLKYLSLLASPIVITADHGELLGEHNVYGHNGHWKILKQVPWLEVLT